MSAAGAGSAGSARSGGPHVERDGTDGPVGPGTGSAAGVRPITVRYFAAARAAAGISEEAAPAGLGLDELATELVTRHGERLATVLKVASFLVDGVAWHDRQARLPQGSTVDVLPPFAGG